MATDPRIEGFDADAFRDGIWTAMAVGLPPAIEDQPSFVTPAAVVDTGDERDVDGVPFDFTKGQAKVGVDTVTQVPAAVEYVDGDGLLTTFGAVASSKIILTLLDEDYEAVRGFSYVVLGGNKYLYERTEPPLGMVDVAIWRIHCRTDDEG
jgi:hypothetical protein